MQIRSKTAALLYSLNSNRANSRQQTVSQSMTFSLPILHIENIIILNNEHRHKQTHSHTYTEHRDAKTHTYVHTFKQTTQKKLQTYTTHKTHVEMHRYRHMTYIHCQNPALPIQDH